MEKTLKVTYLGDYEHPNIIPGAIYDCEPLSPNTGFIDIGFTTPALIRYEECAHLDGDDWEILEDCLLVNAKKGSMVFHREEGWSWVIGDAGISLFNVSMLSSSMFLFEDIVGYSTVLEGTLLEQVTVPKEENIGVLVEKIKEWHKDRNLIHGSNDLAQYGKLQEEVGELYTNLLAGFNPVDDIGDIIIVLINIAERNGLSIEECLRHAYNDIKDRKGTMINGVFVKEN